MLHIIVAEINGPEETDDENIPLSDLRKKIRPISHNISTYVFIYLGTYVQEYIWIDAWDFVKFFSNLWEY